MDFRKATPEDIEGILDIIYSAQAHFKVQGIDQWQNGYPNRAVIAADIEQGNSYVLTEVDDILATVAVIVGIEKTYETIYDGAWLTEGSYATIHRLAVSQAHKGRGIAFEVMRRIERLLTTNSIRIDTQEVNFPMQGLIQKSGYTYCGIIYLADGNKRLAYEKTL